MLKVPTFNRCVGFVLNMSKKWQRNLHSLFMMKDLSRSPLLTSQVEASSNRLISLMLMLMIMRIMMKALKMKTMTDCHV